MSSFSLSQAPLTQPGAGWARTAVYQLAKGKTLAVPLDLHAAARAKVVSLFKQEGVTQGVVLVQGGQESAQYDTDTEVLFRQDSWFNYLFGVKEPGLYGAISIADGKTTLFIPKLPEEYRIWCGTIHPPEHFRESYAVDDVKYTDDLAAWIETSLSVGGQLYVMNGVNSDSGSRAKPARFEGDERWWSENRVEEALLHKFASKARVTKSQTEIDVMHYCAYVGSMAHVEVMRIVKSAAYEYELEAKFLYEIYRNGGCRKCAYTSICACGPNSAVLHYGHAAAPNDRALTSADMALLDMGAEYHGYVSDITCSYPVSGKFTDDQRAVYEGVLNAQRAVLAIMKPGTSWPDCHRAAEREILKALLALGVLQNASVEYLQDNDFGAIFLPHGLGHLIGCDTHDVGGYLEGTPARSTRPGLSKLRTARVLEAGMVLTNEPGCYFIDALLDKALADAGKKQYINEAVLARFRGFGGVRLEDVVLVTETNPQSLSTCPRTVDEIENVLQGGVWPPNEDKAPELCRKWATFDGEKLLSLSL